MTVSTTDSLKFAASKEEDSSSSSINDKKALEIIKKNPNATSSSGIYRADLIEELKKSGLASNPIQANEVLRYLQDNDRIFTIEDSGLLKVITYRNISNFERRQVQLQQEWLGVREFGSSCKIDEEREIKAFENVRGEQQQQQKKRRQYHRHVSKKQTEQQWEVCFAK